MSIDQVIADYQIAKTTMTQKVIWQIDNLHPTDVYNDGHCIFCDRTPEEGHFHECAYRLVKWMKEKGMY